MKHGKRLRTFRSEERAGIISVHPRGFGFVQLDSGQTGNSSESDIFIPASCLGSAMPGDRVLIRIHQRRHRGNKREGSVIKILERGIKEFAGFFNGTYVIPRDERIVYWFFVSRENNCGAKSGDIVIARILSYPSQSGQGEAEITQVLGTELNAEVESKLVLRQYGFKEEFPQSVKSELRRIPERVLPKDLSHRRDIREIPLVTIDPEDARDFDDAVAVKKTNAGFKLWVAIADVSHYVKSGGAIDEESYARATSVYLPDRAVPMLPEPISAGIASLVPNEDRLAMVADLGFDQQGNIISREFYPAVIRSRFRLNYNEAQQILDRSEPLLHKKYQSIEGMFSQMRKLAEILCKRRRQRGGLDFDLPEAKVKLDENGEPIDIYAYPRLFSHRMIEEFMLAANQAVAEFLFGKKLVFPCRIHEPPESKKILELNQFLTSLGFPLLRKNQMPDQIHPRDFQRLFDAVAGKPISGLVSYLGLRAMMQAKYSPDNLGHFGLALSQYCHFTSPIRRYPDLITHRLLKQSLGILPANQPVAPEGIERACEHCSDMERNAVEVEREMVKFYQTKLMSRHIGEEFKGIVSGLTEFGIFVELERPMAEGLIPASALAGFSLNEKAHTVSVKFPRSEIHLGDHVLVKVQATNQERKEIDFQLVRIIQSAFPGATRAYFPAQKRKQHTGKERRRQ